VNKVINKNIDIFSPLDIFIFSCSVLILTILTSSIVSFSDDLKFIVLSSVCLFFYSKSIFYNIPKNFNLAYIDVGLLAFSVIGLISYNWSINGSFTWYPAIGWSLMICWMILIRHVNSHLGLINHLHNFFLFFLFFSISLILFYIFSGLPIGVNWVKYFGNNSNYTSAFLICLLPFGLFCPRSIGSKTFRVFIAFVLSLSMLIIIFYTSTRGCLLTFLILLILKLYLEKCYKILTVGVLIVILMSFLLCSSFSDFFSEMNRIPLFSDFKNNENVGRLYMLKSSFWIFQDNPLLGIGMGNWQLEAYKFDLSDVSPFNSQNFLRHLNHNLFATVLAESGIVGFSLLFLPLLIIVKKSFSRFNELSEIECAFLFSIIAYLINSLFYGSVNFYDGHFSEIQWVAFTGLGILSTKFKRVEYKKSISKFSLIILSLICFLWFSYTAISNNQLYDAKRQLDKGEYLLGISKLSSVYNPVLKTYLHKRQSIAHLIAKSYHKLSDFDSSLSFYEIALQDNPFDATILLEYSTLLFKIGKIDMSLNIAMELLKIDSRNRQTNLLLSKLSLKKMDLRDARNFLNKSYHPWNTYEINMIEQALYKENYLTNILNIDPEGALNETLKNIDPMSNLEKMRHQPWREINIPIVKSIYDFEFSLYRLLDSTNYKIYLIDKLIPRVNHELGKIKKDCKLDCDEIEAIRKHVLEYAIFIELKNLRGKLNLSGYNVQCTSLINIERVLGKSRMNLFVEKLDSYNFGRFLFCNES